MSMSTAGKHNMGVATAFVSALLLSGCGPEYGQVDWKDAPKTHVCTEEQMDRVESEAEWCIEHTSYFGTYCYGSAILRICEQRAKSEGETQ